MQHGVIPVMRPEVMSFDLPQATGKVTMSTEATLDMLLTYFFSFYKY